MPTPHGSRGGMAFSADELRVLRRALAEVLHPAPHAAAPPDAHIGWTGDVQEYVRLAEAVEQAAGEGDRLRSFLLADLRRYRRALPGSAPGYLERLAEALATGYVPGPEDLTALRGLRALPCSPAEHSRRSALLRRCGELAEREVRTRLGGRTPLPVAASSGPLPAAAGRSRGRSGLDVLFPPPPAAAGGEEERPGPRKKPKPGEGDGEGEPAREPDREPEKEAPPEPRPPAREPGRRMPTPAEVWPPHRRRRGQPPSEPGPGKPSQRLELATG